MKSSERRSYSLTKEPSRTLYRSLLRWGSKTGKQLYLVVRDQLDLSANGRRVLDRLEPFLIGKDRSSEWPGTALFDGEAEISTFRFPESAIGIVTEASVNLYGWQQPELPEDLGLLHPDGAPCLVTIAHEEDAYLSLTTKEKQDLVADLPEIEAILVADPILDESEERALVEALREELPTGSPIDSVEHLIQSWRSFVSDVERGYEFSVHDYANDLSSRQILEGISARLSAPLARKLAQRVAPSDDRFLKATEPIRRPLPGAPKGDSTAWWNRIPKRLGDELQADLESEGIL